MAAKVEIAKGPFEPTWESLRTFECPEWFRDAKLGIWAHWGPQCVPMYGDWYARHMYVEGHDQYLHHWRVYGHPSKHGYKDVVKLWKAEAFDPEGLMDLYVKAGAKYFVAQAVHHDNFDNWDSKHNKWNAVKVGPKKNIVQLWQDAARKRGLPFGLTEHLAATFSWWCVNKGADKAGPYAGVPYDGSDPEYEDFYLPNRDEIQPDGSRPPWYTSNPWWHERWLARVMDMVDQHKPDLLYSDGGVPFDAVGLSAIAHLYNTSAALHGGVNQAVYNQKDQEPEIHTVGILDLERRTESDIYPHPWQTDTCVGGWFYDVRQKYKTPNHVIEMLVDIVSKNGNLLLNFTQKPDGTLDDECNWILRKMGEWIAVNGEGLYGTRPWKTAGEGPTAPEGGRPREGALDWTSEDYRFTSKGDTIYAFEMRPPEDGKALVKTLAAGSGPRVAKVALLGAGDVKFEQGPDGLRVELPAELPCEYVHCLRVQTEG